MSWYRLTDCCRCRASTHCNQFKDVVQIEDFHPAIRQVDCNVHFDSVLQRRKSTLFHLLQATSTPHGLEALDSLCEVQKRSVIAWGSWDCNESMFMFQVDASMASAFLKRPSFAEKSLNELLDLFARAVSLHETAPMADLMYREAKESTEKRQSENACVAPTTSTDWL